MLREQVTAILVLAFAAVAAAGERAAVRDDLSADDLARVLAVTAPAIKFEAAEPFEAMAGGAGTSRASVGRDSFSHFSETLSFEEEERFKLGNALFGKLWVEAPSSTQASDGLGPLFNARACKLCHPKDGRGHPPSGPEDDRISMFLRLSVPARTAGEFAMLSAHQASVIGDPVYGTQLQDFAVPGLTAEGQMAIGYTEITVVLADATGVSLRAPTYAFADPNYGPPDPELIISPRVGAQMIGLGLLEAVPEADILARADPDDADGDGISGKTNRALDPVSGELVLGRFGWKAGVASIRAQVAGAFAGDIGISTPLANSPHGDCTPAQAACLTLPTGEQERLGVSEAPDPILDLVTFYAQNLAVPARRDVGEPEVLHGKRVFNEAGCASCHAPKFVTSRNAENPGQRFQLIWPYTDLLLHDMGEGLADHRPEGDADGYEWRTAPLWGIGLTGAVSEHTYFLHDGRARSLLEAILWHGGEAQAGRDRVARLDGADRAALIAFLESL
ncbi:MAG: di-heme oxidoredictase family protein [Cucumibacter sp.]